MKTWRLLSVLAIGLLLFTALPSDAAPRGGHGGGGGFHGGHGHFHGGGPRFFVGIGPVWPGPWWYYPPPYYAYAPPPPVEPPVYVEPAPQQQQYWYFCQSFNTYYPQTQTCPEPWVPVPAR